MWTALLLATAHCRVCGSRRAEIGQVAKIGLGICVAGGSDRKGRPGLLHLPCPSMLWRTVIQQAAVSGPPGMDALVARIPLDPSSLRRFGQAPLTSNQAAHQTTNGSCSTAIRASVPCPRFSPRRSPMPRRGCLTSNSSFPQLDGHTSGSQPGGNVTIVAAGRAAGSAYQSISTPEG
jgi:hypothetical protein